MSASPSPVLVELVAVEPGTQIRAGEQRHEVNDGAAIFAGRRCYVTRAVHARILADLLRAQAEGE